RPPTPTPFPYTTLFRSGDDVVAAGRSRPETEDAAGDEELLVDDPVEQPLRVVVELPRRRLVEDLRELALQLPGVEEELPVDVVRSEEHTSELQSPYDLV